MTKSTLPGVARKRQKPDPREATIPCATTRTPQATHLTGDRLREPSFDDLIAGNDREPSHEDLNAAVDEPAEQPRPKAYLGVAVDALAWLRAQDADDQLAALAARAAQWLRTDAAGEQQDTSTEHQEHDEHAFDADHLIPATTPRRTIDLTRLGTDNAQPAAAAAEALPVLPVGNPRLLFGALDALDRLPGLYAVDAKSFEMAASIAAIQTYAALRPDLLGRHEMHMELAPLAARLAEPAPEPANHAGQLAAAWASIREAHTRFAADGFVPDRRFDTALKLDALDEAIGDLIDATGDVRGLFDAEADDIELLAIEAGLPMRQDDEEPLADWELELLALPEGEPDPGAERVFADMDATSDAVDAWYAKQATASFAPGLRVVHNATGAAGTIVKIALGRALVRLDRAPEGLTPFSFFDLSPEAEPVQFVEHVDYTETKAEIRDLMDLDGAVSWGQL